MTEILPAASYLASLYRDKRRNFETRRVYYDDGRVEAFDGQEWWTVCRFSAAQIAQAKRVMRSVELVQAQDLRTEGTYDTATFTFAWHLDGATGQVTNWVYPAQRHPVIKALEEGLGQIEAEARLSNA